MLYDALKAEYNVQYLITYRLNQDVLENFFGVIRSKGGLYDHPDRLEFQYRMRSYILTYLAEGSYSFDGNTMNDDTPDLDVIQTLVAHILRRWPQRMWLTTIKQTTKVKSCRRCSKMV